jgi:DnaJ-class molecular chaperone
MDPDEFASMFDAFFGQGGEMGGFGRPGARRATRKARPRPAPGPAEVQHDLEISFMTAVRGGTERLRIDTGGRARTIDVTIPKGIEDGAKLRVRGAAEGEAHLILRVRVGSHPLVRRGEGAETGKGLDLYLELPLSIAEATLGATVPIPTLDGRVEVTIPPGSASGRKLRLRGRGIEDAQGRKGDLYAVIKIVPPDGSGLGAEEKALLERLSEPGPRSAAEWSRPRLD